MKRKELETSTPNICGDTARYRRVMIDVATTTLTTHFVATATHITDNPSFTTFFIRHLNANTTLTDGEL